jgi:hypothetical protein
MTEAIEKKWYLAGPMTGYPQFNFPLFDAVTFGLREAGWKIVSPAELDEGPVRDAALASKTGDLTDLPVNHSYGTLLSRDVRIVIDECQGILLLPHWENSRGARLEAYVALLCGHEIKTVNLMAVDGKPSALALLAADRAMVARIVVNAFLPAPPKEVADGPAH